MKKIITVAGGLLIVAAMFLPFVTSPIKSYTIFECSGNDGYIFIGCGAIITIVGLIGKRALYILGILAGIFVTYMAWQYKAEPPLSGFSGMPVAISSGIWLMLAGGIIAVTGSVIGLLKKDAKAGV